MNGAPSSATRSRVFLAFGTIVVLLIALRFVRAGFAALTLLRAGAGASNSPSTPLSPWLFTAAHAGSVALAAGMVVAVIGVVAVGSLRRRPWARPAAFLLLGVGAIAGLAVAAFQVSALATKGGSAIGAVESGYGHAAAGRRVADAVAALLLALLCAAGIRRLASEEVRREFSPERPAGSGIPPARKRPSL